MVRRVHLESARFRRVLVLGLSSSLLAAGAWIGPGAPTVAAGRTFTVNSIGDGADTSKGDGVCDAGGACTLRAAIEEANASSGHDTIRFAIAGTGPHTIRPGGDGLPWLTDTAGATIDGYSQPGAVANTAEHGTNATIRIQLAGQGTGGSDPDGLELRSPGNVVRGLAIYDFRFQLRMTGASSTGNLVAGNFLGTNATASVVGQISPCSSTSSTPCSDGVRLQNEAADNRIGTAELADRNLISGNAGKGISIYQFGTARNVIRNNVIGLAPDGVTQLANRSHGVDLNVGASDNIIGGPGARDGNVISGNGRVGGEGSGIEISHDSFSGRKTTGNQFVGNLIGTTADGSAGTDATRNGEFGINFEGNEGCQDSCPDDISQNAAIGNVIVGSTTNVVLWKGANQNDVLENRIGVLADGSRPASAGFTTRGVLIEVGANRNRIERNVMAHMPSGVQMRAGDPSDSFNGRFAVSGNRLSRNSIHDIGGLGIDLIGPGDLDEGPSSNPGPLVQGGIGYPTIDAVTTASLTGRTCPGCFVEVFVTPGLPCASCTTEFGPGRTWVADGTADSTGAVTITFGSAATGPVVVSQGDWVTMHATDGAGNTSEFSRGVVATASAVVPIRGLQPAERCSLSASC